MRVARGTSAQVFLILSCYFSQSPRKFEEKSNRKLDMHFVGIKLIKTWEYISERGCGKKRRGHLTSYVNGARANMPTLVPDTLASNFNNTTWEQTRAA